MAEYFDSYEAAAAAVQRWNDSGTQIVFFAKVRLDDGRTKWMVDFRMRDYGDAVTVLEDLRPTLAARSISGPSCSHCNVVFNRVTATSLSDEHYRCEICKRVVLCKDCRARFSRGGAFGCPTCGYHDQWSTAEEDDVATTAKWWQFWRR